MDAKYIKAMKPRDLTEEEKQRPYAKLFYKPQPDISDRTKKVVASGEPMDPKYAMTPDNIREKTVHILPEEECGWCYLPGGGAYVTNRHDMPGITLDMYRHWLYWWNEIPEESEMRYKCWCPDSHHCSDFMWSTENIGDYILDLTLTQPLADHPEAIGLDEEICKEAGILMVDGASARQKLFSTDIDERPIPSVAMHFVYDAPDGIIMRSHFWIGFQAMGGKLVNVVGNRPMPEEDMLLGLLEHNSKEMNNLRDLMPILYTEFRDK